MSNKQAMYQRNISKKLPAHELEKAIAKDVGHGSASGKLAIKKQEMIEVWEDEGGNLPAPYTQELLEHQKKEAQNMLHRNGYKKISNNSI